MAWVERTTMLIEFQPPAMCRVANQQPRLPRATSSLALNACRDGASTASLGNLFSASPPSGSEKLPPHIQPKPPLSQFKTIPPCPITIHPHKQSVCTGTKPALVKKLWSNQNRSLFDFYSQCSTERVKQHKCLTRLTNTCRGENGLP